MGITYVVLCPFVTLQKDILNMSKTIVRGMNVSLTD